MAIWRTAALTALITSVAIPASASSWGLVVDGACADAAAFRASTEAQRLRGGEVGDVAIRVVFTADAGARWHVKVELATADRDPIARELDGASCAAVSDAAILIVAQLLDGAARPLVLDQPRMMTPVPGDELAPPRPLAEPVSLRVAVAIGADTGSLPGMTAGGRIGLDVGWWRAVLSLGATRWQPVTTLDARGEGLTVSAWEAFATARFRVVRQLDVGAQIEIGELSARGQGVDTALTSDGSWQAAGATARTRLWSSGRLELALGLELLVPFGRPTFVVDGDPRYRPGLAFRSLVEVGWRLFDGTHGRRP